MKTKTVWSGVYRGISYEINNFKLLSRDDTKDAWAAYMFLSLDKIPAKYKPNSFWLKAKQACEEFKSKVYMYNNHPVIRNIEFHCGCTWYSKIIGHNDERIIQIGCDYQHYWDEGRCYNELIVEHDIKDSIDSFLNMVPEYEEDKPCATSKGD